MGARLLEEELESSHICALSGRPFGGPLSLRLDIVGEALGDGITERAGEMWLCGRVVERKKEVLAWPEFCTYFARLELQFEDIT